MVDLFPCTADVIAVFFRGQTEKDPTEMCSYSKIDFIIVFIIYSVML